MELTFLVVYRSHGTISDISDELCIYNNQDLHPPSNDVGMSMTYFAMVQYQIELLEITLFNIHVFFHFFSFFCLQTVISWVLLMADTARTCRSKDFTDCFVSISSVS